MKTLALAATLLGTLALSSTASAEHYRTVLDPSGAPMCFDEGGHKAELVNCQARTQASHLLELDPSGAPMCFSLLGDKAPLSSCSPDAVVSYVQQNDPSGAPMCFTDRGGKAPLDRCQPAPAPIVRQLLAGNSEPVHVAGLFSFIY